MQLTSILLKKVDLDPTPSSCAVDKSDNTVRISDGAIHRYNNCATANGQNSHNIYITDHTLNVDIFGPCKPSRECLTTLDSLQIAKELKQTINLGNKHLERVTHTSGIKSNSNYKQPLGLINRRNTLLGPASKMYTIRLSDIIMNDNQMTLLRFPWPSCRQR